MINRLGVAVLAIAALASGCSGGILLATPTVGPTTIEGLPVLKVGEVLAARVAGGLRDQRVAVSGYWSDGSVPHSCAPPSEPTGELELYCKDGEWGITELPEPILVIDNSGTATPASGPHLTPIVPTEVPGADELFRIAHVRMPGFAPAPIIVIGHFDDPRAADCRPAARQLCLDRLVVERIALLGDDAP